MIEMQNLSFGYSGGEPLLADMTLSLQPGSFHFLTGPSGAGKTTFLRLCYAELLPTSGRMTAFGQDVTGLSRDGIAGLRRRVGVVHQDTQFLDHLPVAENIALPLMVSGQPVDMAALGEGQNSDEFHVTICVKDSSGPYHFEMNNKLRRIATEHHIPFKIDIYPYYGSDGSAYWRAGGDARVGLIGPGVEASHAYERTHRDSLLHSAHLIARYLVDESE